MALANIWNDPRSQSNGGFGGYSWRVIIPAGNLTGSVDACTVTFAAPTNGPMTIGAAAIGYPSAPGSFDFDGAQVALTFAGAGAASASAGGYLKSDRAEFAIDNTRDILISAFISDGGIGSGAPGVGTLTKYNGGNLASTTAWPGNYTYFNNVPVTSIDEAPPPPPPHTALMSQVALITLANDVPPASQGALLSQVAIISVGREYDLAKKDPRVYVAGPWFFPYWVDPSFG